MTIVIKITDDYGVCHSDIGYEEDEIYARGLYLEGNQKDALIKLINSVIDLIDASEYPKTTGDEDYTYKDIAGCK
jgi:hypothetical protein